ncbi:alpha/beta hydrolase [Vibrio hippocampi]|uniref:2-succinyl-6-hydroxy-2, 4-cyclohexadiene-1-carboxylate synthase n=1 Tax=Vibrio hippocampi TaxID=654686 RepID=A0ABM8ZJ33_9VIBR|nr:alpha/beta hydrolase [Vibrio hippocampi]CAH0526680.1 2-succinyl-6-hydroxy-2, 4-cyclohexadiene-1-carboxylate synthase [Vibrio hippocampi]
MWQHKELALSQHQSIAYLEWLPQQPAVHTLVFIHGWMDNLASFHPFQSLIAEHGENWRVIMLDLPGHGHSSHKSDSNYYHFFDYIDDLAQVLDKIQAVKPVLIGHSLGALIASCYSACFSESVAGLVQIEGHFPIAEDDSHVVARLKSSIQSRKQWRSSETKKLPSFEMAVQMRMRATKLDCDTVSPIVERDVIWRSDTQAWYWRHDRRLKCESIYRMTPQHSKQLMASVTVPHLVILGRQGYRQLQQTQYLELLTRANIVYVDGDHHCHLESPWPVFEQILTLVNKI